VEFALRRASVRKSSPLLETFILTPGAVRRHKLCSGWNQGVAPRRTHCNTWVFPDS
jgi:hypothetical protein